MAYFSIIGVIITEENGRVTCKLNHIINIYEVFHKITFEVSICTQTKFNEFSLTEFRFWAEQDFTMIYVFCISVYEFNQKERTLRSLISRVISGRKLDVNTKLYLGRSKNYIRKTDENLWKKTGQFME